MALNEERKRRFGFRLLGAQEPLQQIAIGLISTDSETEERSHVSQQSSVSQLDSHGNGPPARCPRA